MFLNSLNNGVINIGFNGMVANPDIYTKTNRAINNMAKNGLLLNHPILTFSKRYFDNVSAWITFLFLIYNHTKEDIKEFRHNDVKYISFGDTTLAIKSIIELEGENNSDMKAYFTPEYSAKKIEQIKSLGCDDNADFTCYFLYYPHKKETFQKIDALKGKQFDASKNFKEVFMNIAKTSKENMDMFFLGVVNKEDTFFVPNEFVNQLLFSSMKAPQA